jgi:hypothetical protein
LGTTRVWDLLQRKRISILINEKSLKTDCSVKPYIRNTHGKLFLILILSAAGEKSLNKGPSMSEN